MKRASLKSSIAAAVVAIFCLLLAGSAAAESDGGATEQGAQPPALAKFGRIDAVVRQARRPNCWTLVLRGDLTNPYDQDVDGVRLVVRLRGEGDNPREIERLESKLHMAIPAAKSVRFDREFSTACTSAYSDISVIAFADRRGGVDLPLPDADVEAAAANRKEAFSSAGIAGGLNSAGTFTAGSYSGNR